LAAESTDVKPEFALHYNRGLEFERRGKYEQAVEAYCAAVRIHPFDSDAQVRLGMVLRELARDDEANRAFLTALALKRRASLPPHRRRGELPFDSAS
jgi:Flp pilus assembly protein TadD